MLGAIRLRFAMTAIVAASVAFVAMQATLGSLNTADLPLWPHTTPRVVGSFEPGGPLHCSGIERMTPARASSFLRARGYRVWWLLTVNGTDSTSVRKLPAGVLVGAAASPGEPLTNTMVAHSTGAGPMALLLVAPAGSPAARAGWAPPQACP